jgi:hypothetical protein
MERGRKEVRLEEEEVAWDIAVEKREIDHRKENTQHAIILGERHGHIEGSQFPLIPLPQQR